MWLVTGAGGMLGGEVLTQLAADGHEVAGLGHAELDVTSTIAVETALRRHRPDVVVNCAAYTKVDEAEANESEAFEINALGPRNLAMACASIGGRLVHVSTDYVFAGDAVTPYDEDSEPAPRTAYGRSKLAGEQAVRELLPHRSAVVRTAWLYGERGRSFVRMLIRLERERETLDVVADQRGQPTWTVDLAGRLVDIGRRSTATGIFHATNSGDTTWWDLAREVFRLLGADPERICPTATDRFPAIATRPAYSVLGHRRCAEDGMEPLRHWQSALRVAFPRLLRAEEAEAHQT
jgi:dTDP-4-dehydrorhamnose reductase